MGELPIEDRVIPVQFRIAPPTKMCEGYNCDFYETCSIKERVRDPKCEYYQEKYTYKIVKEVCQGQVFLAHQLNNKGRGKFE